MAWVGFDFEFYSELTHSVLDVAGVAIQGEPFIYTHEGPLTDGPKYESTPQIKKNSKARFTVIYTLVNDALAIGWRAKRLDS